MMKMIPSTRVQAATWKRWKLTPLASLGMSTHQDSFVGAEGWAGCAAAAAPAAGGAAGAATAAPAGGATTGGATAPPTGVEAAFPASTKAAPTTVPALI